jgi:hypothetical protein
MKPIPASDERGHAATRDLAVEERQPAPRHHQLEPVDRDRRDEGDRDHGCVAAQLEADARGHHAPAEGRRPPRQDVARGDDPGQPGAGVLELDVAVQHLSHDVVDQREVLVVDLALLHLPDQHDGRLLGLALERHRQRGERHVDVRVAHAVLPRQRLHRGHHVRGSGPRGEQQLAHPEAEVEGQVELAGLQHGRHGGSRLVHRSREPTPR